MSPETFAYRRFIIIGGIFGIMASLGFGRFALGMMLPALGEALTLSYSQMGWVGTINFCGYLGAVLLCGVLSARLGSRLLIFLAFVLIGGSMIGIAFSRSYPTILFLYFLTGVGSAFSTVPIMALIGGWFDSRSRGRAAGFCVMGNGLAILVAGKLVPVLNNSAWGWRLGWLVFGAVVLAIALLCGLVLRNPPAEEVRKTSGSPVHSSQRELQSAGKGVFYFCGLIYFLYGLTYAIYVTFFVTAMVQDRGLSEASAGYLWSWFGLISLVSGPLFGYLSDRCGRTLVLVLVFVMQTLAHLLLAARLPLASVYVSIGCFGLVVWSIPAIMAALISDYAGSRLATAMFGLVTFCFGIGQIGGPWVAGMLAESSGTMEPGFLLAGILTLIAAGLSVLLPQRKPLS